MGRSLESKRKLRSQQKKRKRETSGEMSILLNNQQGLEARCKNVEVL